MRKSLNRDVLNLSRRSEMSQNENQFKKEIASYIDLVNELV